LRRFKATAIFVTHDQDEALVLSDRVVVMNSGRAEQIGTPTEIYAAPTTPFVLDFVGQSGQLRGCIVAKDGRLARIETAYGTLSAETALSPGTRVLLAVRPEKITVGAPASEFDNSLEAEIKETVYLGSKTHVLFKMPPGERLIAELAGPLPDMREGARYRICWPIQATFVYAEVS
jgi:putative spermidine/putrescine transport system ATP-binding protein